MIVVFASNDAMLGLLGIISVWLHLALNLVFKSFDDV